MTALLFLMMGLIGCNGETANIDFPFEVGDIENIEMSTSPIPAVSVISMSAEESIFSLMKDTANRDTTNVSVWEGASLIISPIWE